MKKLVCVILSALLMLGGAFAEMPDGTTTRIRTVETENAEISFEETLFVSEYGYSVWYPAEQVSRTVQYDHDCFILADAVAEENASSYMIVPVEVSVEDADAMLSEAVGGYTGKFAITEYPEKTLENGVAVRSVQVEQEGMIHRFYLVMNEERMLCITAMYPSENAGDVGVWFERMTETFEFVSAEKEAE